MEGDCDYTEEVADCRQEVVSWGFGRGLPTPHRKTPAFYEMDLAGSLKRKKDVCFHVFLIQNGLEQGDVVLYGCVTWSLTVGEEY